MLKIVVVSCSLVVILFLEIVVAGQRGAVADAAVDATHVSGTQVGGCAKSATLVTDPAYTVICYSRSSPGRAEAHAGHTHVWYIVDGEATLVTGGTIVNVEMERPGEPRGSGITGGVARRLVSGDVIVIPAGVAHQYTEVRSPVAYYSVNVNLPEQRTKAPAPRVER